MDSFTSTSKKLKIPLLSDAISAGFPSPADDYTEENIDLNEHLISNPFSTFFLRVKGDSMINAGIQDKDLIIVDKSLTAKPGDIIIAMIDGEFTIKRLSIKNNELYLKAENHIITQTSNLKIILTYRYGGLSFIQYIATYENYKY